MEPSVYYQRTPTDSEIDFVGPGLELPFESKYSDRNLKQQALTVKGAYKRGILASRNVLQTSEPEWLVPTGILAWLLG